MPDRRLPLAGQRPGELLGEEGEALGAVVDGMDQRARGRVAEHLRQQRRGAGFVERLERDLVEDAAAAQVAAQAPQRVFAREFVGAVRGDDQQGGVGEGGREVGEQLQGGRVGPVQVVEHE